MSHIQERIGKLIEAEEETPEKDGAGIITAHGIDASVRRKALKQCLDICRSGGKRTG